MANRSFSLPAATPGDVYTIQANFPDDTLNRSSLVAVEQPATIEHAHLIETLTLDATTSDALVARLATCSRRDEEPLLASILW